MIEKHEVTYLAFAFGTLLAITVITAICTHILLTKPESKLSGDLGLGEKFYQDIPRP